MCLCVHTHVQKREGGRERIKMWKRWKIIPRIIKCPRIGVKWKDLGTAKPQLGKPASFNRELVGVQPVPPPI